MLDLQNISAPLKAQLTRARISRAKVFGSGRPRPMEREAKAKLAAYLRARRGSRALSRSHFDVAERLLFKFHNAASGRCFPSLAAIAAAAGVARSTVQAALAALERLGVLSWVHRLKREVVDGVVCVRRSSNGYQFSLPPSLAAGVGVAQGSRWAIPLGPASVPAAAGAIAPAAVSADRLSPVEAALARLGAARSAREAR